MDRLLAMRTFVEIVERGSLTGASETLGKSLPAVVRTLAELERAVDTVLIRRTTRRMSLTEEGRVYFDRCQRILADVQEAEDLIGAGRTKPEGLLRVTAPVLFGQMHVAPPTLDFVRTHAAIRVELLLLDRLVNLVEEGVDLAVRIGNLADSTSIATTVGTMRYVVCASPTLLRERGVPSHPSALSGLPCVNFRGNTHGATWSFREGDKDLAVAVSGRFNVNQAAAAVQACAKGFGFGQFFAYQVEPLLRTRKLRVVLQNFEQPAAPVSLVYADARLMSGRLRAYIDWMKPRLSSLPEVPGT